MSTLSFLFPRLVSEVVPGHLQPTLSRLRAGKQAKDQATAAQHQEDQSIRHEDLNQPTSHSLSRFDPNAARNVPDADLWLPLFLLGSTSPSTGLD